MVSNVLITGANRGIGLEFVKQFASHAKPPIIFATTRCPQDSTVSDQID